MAIYVTSDLHFCHNRPFLYEPRGFISIQEMNDAIIRNWNQVVSDDDLVFILGDIMLNDNELGCKFFNQLKGDKVIILGNHDTDNRKELYRHLRGVNGLRSIKYADQIKYNGYNFYLSHYPTLTSRPDIKRPLNKILINLCGHIHTKDRFEDWDKGYIYHCELDAHNMYPVLIDNIIKDIEEKYNGRL